MTLFICEGLLRRESSSEDVRDREENKDNPRLEGLLLVLGKSPFEFASTGFELGLVGGVSKLGDVVVPKPRPTTTDIINLHFHKTETLTALRSELSTIAPDTVDLLFMFVDVA